MANSKRSQEGYLLIDHRASPGVERAGTQGGSPVVGSGASYESATITCSHCQRVVILNPMRTRERHYCRGCDHYICDNCANTPGCLPFNALLDKMQEKAFQAEKKGDVLHIDNTIDALRRDILG